MSRYEFQENPEAVQPEAGPLGFAEQAPLSPCHLTREAPDEQPRGGRPEVSPEPVTIPLVRRPKPSEIQTVTLEDRTDVALAAAGLFTKIFPGEYDGPEDFIGRDEPFDPDRPAYVAVNSEGDVVGACQRHTS